MSAGAVILAAGMSSRMGSFKPMLRVGSETAVRMVISTLRRAGAEPVALVTGNRAEELESHVSDLGVVCLRNERYADTQMLESVKLGLEYMRGRCDSVLLTPADIPLFSEETARALIGCEAEFAAPTYGGRAGHPVLISGELIPFILSYDGEGGLAGAILAGGYTKKLLEVRDEGILPDMDTPEDYRRLLELYRRGSRENQCHTAE